MNVNERIKSRRMACGLTQDQVANRVGVTRVAVSHWERGGADPNGRYLNELAAALGVSVDWLLTGKEEGTMGVSEPPFPGYRNVEPAEIPQGTRVPILSYVQAGQWREMCEQATAFDGSLEYVAAGVSVGSCAFGLWVRGNSMEPDFKEGDLLIVDPDEAPKAGDFVIAKNGSEEATFKKYRSRGEYDDGRPRFELVPLNDDHETLSTDQTHISIIGVVVEHRRILKRG
ncbi:helix-turn-helix domain-containing protein [Aeromonas caviae]|uniref:Helix-turn-helix domain-containing protein n=1 Tax=Aeromonas caviae TaxID=648 RepID=A0A7T3X5I4_AERCA|nr:S24 family peptidase [Aeromonas caviae]QQA62438.1 helix-turn-helix domain-containing protein [Aeromonas caviae]